jgi:hypothetical protein
LVFDHGPPFRGQCFGEVVEQGTQPPHHLEGSGPKRANFIQR